MSQFVAIPVNNGNVTKVASAYEHVIYIRNKIAYSFSRNNYGQLGLGDTNDRSLPEAIPGHANLVDVSVGYYHSLLLNSDGNVYSMGRNQVNFNFNFD